MNDTSTLLLATACVLPVVGLVVMPWLGRGSAFHGCLAGGIVAAFVAISTATSIGEVEWPTWGPVDWLDLSSASVGLTVQMGVRFDAVALGGSISLLLAGALLLACPSRHREREAICVVLAVLAGIGALVANDVVQWLVCVSLVTIAACTADGSRTGVVGAGAGTRRILLVHLIGDLLLIVAILMLWFWLPTGVDPLGFGSLAVWNPNSILAGFLGTAETDDVLAGRLGRISLIGFAALGAASARSGAFPFFGWMHDAGQRTATSSILLVGVAGPLGALILLRFAGVLVVANDVRLVLVMGGGLTAVVSGLITIAQNEPRVVLGYAIASTVGILLTGLGSGMGAVAVVPLLALPFVAAAISWGASHAMTSPGRRVAVVGAVVLVSGVLGTADVIGARLDGNAAGGVLVTALVFAGSGLTAYGTTRMLLRLSRDPATAIPPAGSALEPAPVTPAVVEPLVYLGLGGCLFAAWNVSSYGSALGPLAGDVATSGRTILGVVPGILAASVGAVAAWTMSGREDRDAGRVGEPLGPVVRLSRHRFYIDEFVHLFVSLPARAFAQICRFVDWFVIDGLLSGGPRTTIAALNAATRSPRAGSISLAVLATTLAVGVLLWTLAW